MGMSPLPPQNRRRRRAPALQNLAGGGCATKTAKLLAAEILLSGPESLGSGVLESCL